MAFTADAIIANIESRLGDSGRHVWDFYKMATGAPWCVGEVSYTFNKTGNKSKWYGGKAVFYVPWAQEWMAKHWTTVYDYRGTGELANVRKGDVVIFMWTKGSRDHIGFARAKGTDSELNTVEGNTSGGIVAKKTRAKKNIYAVYRPPYQGTSKEDPKPAPKPSAPTFTKGKSYTVQVNNLNVRTGPGTNYSVKAKKELTADGRKHSNSKGQLKKGTKVTVLEVRKSGSHIWIRIPSGWICAYNGAKYYVK